MAIQYNSQYVDEKYLPILEPNLYTDTVIIPGVTYTDKYVTGPAGQLFVHKLTKGAVITPGAPGRDFTDVAAADTLIAIQLNNNFQKSTKIYGVQANAVAFNMGESYMQMSVETVRESRQYSALACLVHEGTADADTTAIATGAAAVAKLIDLRKAIKDNHGRANYAMVSTEIYALLLSELGLREVYDPAIRTAEMMNRFGLRIMECNSFDLAAAKYIDYTGTTQTVDLSKVEFIVGYNEAFSIVPNLEAMRMKDSEHFIGTLAQVEMNMAFRVTSPDQVIVKSHA